MHSSRFLLGVVVWLTVSSIPAQTDAAAQSPAAPARPSSVKDVTPDEAEALLKANTNVVVLDIRTPTEYAAGHLAGATNVDFNAANFAETIAKLDKSKPYLLHCASGRRSTSSLPQLEKLQFTNVYHLKSGFNAWQRAAKPVVK